MHSEIPRGSAGIQQSTIGVDFSLIHTVLEAAKDADILSINLDVIDRPRRICKKDGLIGNSNKGGEPAVGQTARCVDRSFGSREKRALHKRRL